VEEALAVAPRAGPAIHVGTQGTVLLAAAAALRAHGHPEAARQMAERAVAWHRQAGHRDPDDALGDLDLVQALALAGRWEECRDAAVALAGRLAGGGGDLPLDVVARGWAGVAAAHCGDLDAARREAAALAAESRPFLLGVHLHQAARIHARLGETDRALDLLRAAFAAGMEWGYDLREDVAFEPLLGLGGFEELVGPKG
jgi:hypothetical protein